MNILKWFGWEREEQTEFDSSRRLFLRKGAMVMLAPIVVPPAITYFFPPSDQIPSLALTPDAAKLSEAWANAVAANFFVSTPFQGRLNRMKGAIDPFYGGSLIREPFTFIRS